MARPLRVEYDGAWYHVMHRGAGRRKVFLSSADRLRFFDLLRDIHAMWDVETHAYSLMGNHYHLLLHTPSGNLSRAMRHIDGVYTQRFNRAHQTDGSLFRGRFKSIVIEKDSYLLELVRYIHLNPVRAGFCRAPSGHRWTSHIAYLDKNSRPPWIMIDEVLSMFGKRYGRAVRELDRFVKAGVPVGIEKRLSGKRLPSVLGSEGFKDWIKYNFIVPLRSNKEIPEARRATRRNVSLRAIERLVQEFYEVSKVAGVRGNRPDVNEARAMAIYLMRRVSGAKHCDIAKKMGGMSTAAVAKSLQRFEQKMAGDEGLMDKAESFANHLLSNVQT